MSTSNVSEQEAQLLGHNCVRYQTLSAQMNSKETQCSRYDNSKHARAHTGTHTRTHSVNWYSKLPHSAYNLYRFTGWNTITQTTWTHTWCVAKNPTQTHSIKDKDKHKHLRNWAKCHSGVICPCPTQTIYITPVCPIAIPVKPLLSACPPPPLSPHLLAAPPHFFSLWVFFKIRSLISPAVAVLLWEAWCSTDHAAAPSQPPVLFKTSLFHRSILWDLFSTLSWSKSKKRELADGWRDSGSVNKGSNRSFPKLFFLSCQNTPK